MSGGDVNVKLSRLLLMAHKFNNFYLNGKFAFYLINDKKKYRADFIRKISFFLC